MALKETDFGCLFCFFFFNSLNYLYQAQAMEFKPLVTVFYLRLVSYSCNTTGKCLKASSLLYMVVPVSERSVLPSVWTILCLLHSITKMQSQIHVNDQQALQT